MNQIKRQSSQLWNAVMCFWKAAQKFVAVLFIYCLAQSIAYANGNLSFAIDGISGDVLQNVESRLAAVQATYGKTLSADKVESIYQQAPQEIRKALEPYGYFKPSISGELLQQKNDFVAKFSIKPGPVLRITRIDVSVAGPGENNPKIEKYLSNFPIETGDIFKTETYEKAKEDLFQIANEQGYIKAYLAKSKVTINLVTYEASIVLHLQTGPRYYFGTVNFEESPYSSRFLQRFVPFNENQPFSSQKLITFQQELANTFYFQQVVVTPDFDQAQNYRVPITVSVDAPKAKRYTIGVGYGSYTGPRLTAGATLRRVTNTGQHLDAQLKLSSVLSGLAAKYYIPGKDPLTDQWLIGANYQRFLPKKGSSSSETLTAGYVRKTHHFQTSLNLNFLFERYKVVGQPTRASKLLYPSLILSYTKADDLINPRFGKSVSLTVQGATEDILSSTSFAQALLKAKYMYSPFSFGSFILRGELGYTAVHSLNDLPLSMRFFAGGINSVRGYPDSSIGPGRYLEVGSIEYQQHIVGNWNAAIFYDVGTATDHWGSALFKGEGVGVIYKSLVGPINLYVARAMSKPKKPYVIEFSIGPEF